MKATVYVFGNFAEGYSQYPDDYSHEIIGSISQSRQGATELVYHRDGSLVYYIYTREISHSANTYIGLCYVFNGVLVKDLSFLFNIFEDTVTNIVVKGDLLEFTDDGDLSTQVCQLYSYTEELQRVSDYLNSKLTSLGGYAEKLPPPNYAVSGTEWKTLFFDEIADVRNALRDYSNIRVVKGENYDTDSMKGYAHKLKNQNNVIIQLTNELSKRKKEITKLNQQKKQFKWILILMFLIFLGVVIFYNYAQSQKQVITGKTNEISILMYDNSIKDQWVQRLRNDSTSLANHYYSVKQILDYVFEELLDTNSSYLYFDSWTSTNHGLPNSNSQITYAFYAYEDDELNIPYFVSSESGNDYLIIKLKRNGQTEQQILKKSGIESGTLSHTITESDSYLLTISYTKDGSVDKNSDNAGVNRFSIYRPIFDRLRNLADGEQE